MDNAYAEQIKKLTPREVAALEKAARIINKTAGTPWTETELNEVFDNCHGSLSIDRVVIKLGGVGGDTYKLATTTAFEHLVTDHAATLDADYLRKLVRKQGSAIACTMPLLDALRHDVELGDWISENIVESPLQANEWLDFCGAGAETIGEIDGSPVWFNRRAGIYCYALAAGLGTVEVWLTAPHYPPGW